MSCTHKASEHGADRAACPAYPLCSVKTGAFDPPVCCLRRFPCLDAFASRVAVQLRAIVWGGMFAPAMLQCKHVFRVLRGKPLARRTDCTHDACEAPGKELAPQQCKQTVLVVVKGVV